MGSLVACPVRARGTVHSTSGPGSDLATCADDDDEDDVVRIPIEIRPRGRLGLKSARSWGRGGSSSGGGGHSAISLDLDKPELERARREWALSIQSRDQEVSKLRSRLEALELRHRRVCTELKALQRTCATLKRERHQALVAEQQALARARVFLSERDRARHQLAALVEARPSSVTPTASLALAPPQSQALKRLAAAKCLLDVNLDATPTLAVVEHFVGGANWRLDGATASDGVLRLAVVAESLGEADRDLLAAAAAPLQLHLLLLLPTEKLTSPEGFEMAPFERCAAMCRRLAAEEAARLPCSPFSRLWRPPGFARLLCEQRHILHSEVRKCVAKMADMASLREYLETATPLLALHVSATEREPFLTWLMARMVRPGVFYFASHVDGASVGCPLALLRQFLVDHLAVTPELLTPSSCPERDLIDFLSDSVPKVTPREPLAVVLDGAIAAFCPQLLAATVPPIVKVFHLDPNPQETEEKVSLDDAERNVLTAILDDVSMLQRPQCPSNVIIRLLERRILRLSVVGLEFCSSAVRTAVYRLLDRHPNIVAPRDRLLGLLDSVSAFACGLVTSAEPSATLTSSDTSLAVLRYLSKVLCAANEAPQAVTLLLRAWERLEAELEPEDGRLTWCLAELAVAMETAGRTGDAMRVRRQLGASETPQLSWRREERTARVERLLAAPTCGEVALLWAVAKKWHKLKDLSSELANAQQRDTLIAWQAVALAHEAEGQSEERERALQKAYEVALAIGNEEVAAAVRNHF